MIAISIGAFGAAFGLEVPFAKHVDIFPSPIFSLWNVRAFLLFHRHSCTHKNE